MTRNKRSGKVISQRNGKNIRVIDSTKQKVKESNITEKAEECQSYGWHETKLKKIISQKN